MKKLFFVLIPFLFLFFSCLTDEHYMYLQNIDDSISVHGDSTNAHYRVPAGTIMYFQWHFTGDENISDEVEITCTDNLTAVVCSDKTIKVTALAAGEGKVTAVSEHYGPAAVFIIVY